MTVHYTEAYIRHPQHRVTVDVIGCGGTGSHVLTGLARINMALAGLEHPGLQVRAWDPDEVSEHNIGRQIYSPADIGYNKALVLISRINRFYGTEWEAVPEKYVPLHEKRKGNILITCTDTAESRIKVANHNYVISDKNKQPYDRSYYWLDIGNKQNVGQVVLGTMLPVRQPKTTHKTKASLKNVVKKFPAIKKVNDEDNGPSCSMAEALNKQDLFINSLLAQLGCNLLWKLIKEGMITHHGCFVNIENFIVNPIKI